MKLSFRIIENNNMASSRTTMSILMLTLLMALTSLVALTSLMAGTWAPLRQASHLVPVGHACLAVTHNGSPSTTRYWLGHVFVVWWDPDDDATQVRGYGSVVNTTEQDKALSNSGGAIHNILFRILTCERMDPWFKTLVLSPLHHDNNYSKWKRNCATVAFKAWEQWIGRPLDLWGPFSTWVPLFSRHLGATV